MLTQYPGISPSWSKKLHICIHFLNNPRQREQSLKIDVNFHVVAGGSHSIQSIKKVIDIMNGWYASQLPGKAGRSACCDYFIILEVLTEIELSGNLLNALLIASFNVCVGFGKHPPPPPLFCWVIARRWLRDCLLAIHKQWDLSLRLVLIKPQREEKYLPFSDLLDWIQGAEYNLVQYMLPQPLPPPPHTPTSPIHKYTLYTHLHRQSVSVWWECRFIRTYTTFFMRSWEQYMSFYQILCTPYVIFYLCLAKWARLCRVTWVICTP